MNKVLSHTIVAAGGLFIGFAYHASDDVMESSRSEVTETVLMTSQPSTFVNNTPAIKQVESKVNADELTGFMEDIAAGYKDELTLDEPEINTDTFSSVKDLLANTSSDMFENGEIESISASFTDWFNASENPGRDIMEFLMSDRNSDEEKHVMEYLMASNTAMQSIEGLDQSLVTQLGLASPDEYAQWENVMNIVSISSSEARAELMNTLPNIDNNEIVSASLLAIKPEFVSPSERSQLLNDIALYAESDSPEVRSAAIMSLGQWSAQGYDYIVEDMLVNGTDDQKNAAIISASSGNIWSNQIVGGTLSILNDESVPIEIRNNAFYALSNQPLNDYSYEQLHVYYTDNILPMEN